MSRFNVGGTSQWLYNLSKGLDESSISNFLIVGNCPEGELEDSRLSTLKYKKIDGLSPKANPIKTIQAFFSLRREIKVINPDIVNTHTSKAGALGRIAAKSVRSKARVIHTYHGHVLQGYFNPVLESLIKWIEVLLSYFTDLFLVSGEQVLEDLRSAKIIRNKQANLIWPAVPPIQLGDRKKLRESMGIPEKSIVFGWLGRKVPIKRIDRILELASLRPEYIFILAGDGESIRKKYSEYFFEERPNLIELGFTSPSIIWAVSDVCLLTSDNEAMPISPIEAAICGIPTIGTDAGSTKEVVIHGQTGFVIPKNSRDLLFFADKLASSKELREHMGKTAREFASARFSIQSSIDQQIAGYRGVLQNGITINEVP